ncbi:Processing alpha glucosidase I [Steccherinum ochraceum]|uniref:Mannosyl-oligosaccharide glucosidase n=1 Tax=Steccherinum ochraceum TaxID=92696 RepID=A0A4V2MX64_9APHY|nr:Processing alpha glucosidase I [Steccherinum ochraceum]
MKWLWPAILLAGPVLGHANNGSDTLVWGAYRPNLYFGLRPRIKQSLMTGLMWFGVQDYKAIGKTRHACDQGDELDSYIWSTYDAREGGVQVIKDGLNNLKLTTEFLKVPGGEHGGSWAARIKGEPLSSDKPLRMSMIFYAGMDGLGGLDMETEENENGLDEPLTLTGSSPGLDDFTLRIVQILNTLLTGPMLTDSRNGLARVILSGCVSHQELYGKHEVYDSNHSAKRETDVAPEHILQNVIQHGTEAIGPWKEHPGGPPDPSFVYQLSDEVLTGSTLYAVQKLLDGPFQFDVFFESASAKQKLNSATLDEGIRALTESYNRRFDEVFPVPSTYKATNLESVKEFSKAITSNLIGGVGYFYGTSIVDKGFAFEWDQEDDADDSTEEKGAKLTEPRELLTATPSRSFFPRGFYWDEGFHLLHIGEWDNDLSLEILKDWIGLINDDGWVGREQILGEEARSKVPAEFQAQVPTFANPPTVAMAVTAFINRLKTHQSGPSAQDLGMDFGMGGAQIPLGNEVQQPPSVHSRYLEDSELSLSYLKSIYKPLKRHYDWFRRTQRGQIKQYGRKARSRTEAYRWRGRSKDHVLTSGMDDYPRGPPHAGELHLDLISWMAFFTRTMKDIAEFVGETDDAVAFGEIERAMLDNIEDLHWSDEHKMYCDANINDEDESYHVCDKGYLSLFPLLLSLLPPDSPHLGHILDLLRDPEHLWSPYGLRSLSASHELFGQGENYWKGPIWIQMNYLALGALHKTYGAQEGPYQQRAKEIYSELRKNVIDNVHKEYERTGYVWEQYDALTGEGRRSHPFTGWTSLVTLIISEKY